jgi:hypothetical protein
VDRDDVLQVLDEGPKGLVVRVQDIVPATGLGASLGTRGAPIRLREGLIIVDHWRASPELPRRETADRVLVKFIC